MLAEEDDLRRPRAHEDRAARRRPGAPTDRVFEPVTKWAIRIDRAELVPEVLHQAVAKAGGGRPGPVYSSRPARLHALRCQTALDWDGTDPIREG
jgi:thiamine pyrophosphate-dependent acetolactate synthase large subunit-like protein